MADGSGRRGLEDWPSDAWIALLDRDPSEKALWLRLNDIAVSAGKGKFASAIAFCELSSSIHLKKLELAPRYEASKQFGSTLQEQRELRALQSRPHAEAMRSWFDQNVANPFSAEGSLWLAHLVKIESARIVSRRSPADAIEYANAHDKLNDFEEQAYDIVLGKRRVRAADSDTRWTPPAFRIAKKIRRDWMNRKRTRPPVVERDLSGADLVKIAIPILDELAGSEVPAGDPVTDDPMTMNPPSIAILFALAKIHGRAASPRGLSRLLREHRKRTSKQHTDI
jgi:hypothetical protein